MGWRGGWYGKIAHSLLHLRRQNKFSLLYCGLSSKDILPVLLEMATFGDFSLTSSLTAGIEIPGTLQLFPANCILTFHIPGIQLTDQRSFAKR